jgi:hypothetical protein
VSIGVLVFATFCAIFAVLGYWTSLAGESYYRLLAQRTGDRSTSLDASSVQRYVSRGPWAWFVRDGPRLLQARLNALATDGTDPIIAGARQRYAHRRRVTYIFFFAGLIVVAALLRY